MNNYYPIHINLTGKKVVVIGGGLVAERKVTGMLDTGAVVEIVSPDITEKLSEIIEAYDSISWKKKHFSENDLAEAFLIFAATNNRNLNLAIKNSSNPSQLVNLADEHLASSFIVPSIVKRGKLTISVSTSGSSPILTKKIRQHLEDTYDERYSDYLEFLHTCRSYILQHVDNPVQRTQLLTAIVDPAFIESTTREKDFQDLYNRIMELT